MRFSDAKYGLEIVSRRRNAARHERAGPSISRDGASVHSIIGRAARAVFLLLFACLSLLCFSCRKAPTISVQAPKSVRVVPATKRTITASIEYAARIAPAQEITITSKVSGRVAAVHADVGDRVKQGQALFSLDQKDYEAQYRQAQAALASARANLARTNDSSIGQQVLEAQAAVSQAKVQLDNVKSDYDKMSKLLQGGAISKQQFDDMEAKYKSAQIQLDTAKDNLSLIQNKAGPQSTDVVSAQVDQAQAQADLAKNQLDNTVITSPVDGIVSVRNVEAGEIVGTSTLAFVVIDVHFVLAEAGVSERVVGRITAGEKVEVNVNALAASGQFQGTVDSVSPAADPRTGLYTVKVRIENSSGSIKPGMLAKIRLAIEQHNNALSVPNAAVFTENGAEYLFAVEGQTAKKRRVEIGFSDSADTEVTTNLVEGELVVLEGQSFLNDGDQVNPVQ